MHGPQPTRTRPSLLAQLPLLALLCAPAQADPAPPQGTAPAPAAWAAFERGLGRGLSFTPSPLGFEARGSLSLGIALDGPAAVDEALRRVLAGAADLLEATPEALHPTLRQDVAGSHHVQLEQHVEGAPVRGGRVDLRFTHGGELTLLRASGLVRGGFQQSFYVRPEEARELARLGVPHELGRTWAAGARRIALRAADGRPEPAWEVEVSDPSRPDAAWIVTLDGIDGSLRELRSAILDALTGNLDGRGMAAGPLGSGAPSVLPIANAYVNAFQPAASLLRITDDLCDDEQTVMSADGARIAWVSDCGGDREIWTALADGSGLLQLTVDAGDDHSPALSADGSRIVFVSARTGNEQLFAIDSAGGGLTQLTFGSARNFAPSLAGDGTRVVYLSDTSGALELHTLLVAAPSPVQLTSGTLPEGRPRISLDGSRIAWASRAGGDAEIYSMDPSGGALVQVTVNELDDLEPVLSPDGTRVAFVSLLPPLASAPGDLSAQYLGVLPAAQRVAYQMDLFEAAADGSELRRLTDTGGDEREPSYSADGASLAYVTGEDGHYELEVLHIATGNDLRLSAGIAQHRAPSAGPSGLKGTWIAHEGDGEVWVWDLGLGGSTTTTSDDTGAYTLMVPDGPTSVSSRLSGRWARVVDLDPRWPNLRVAGSFVAPGAGADLHFNPLGSVEGPTAQVTAYTHTDRAHGVLAGILTRPPLSLPSPLPIDEQLRVRANFPQAIANAFYNYLTQEATYFIGGGPLRPNTAYDTLVLHETGHFYDDLIGGIGSGSPCEAVGGLAEGFADMVALLVSGSPIIGEDFFGPGTAVRHYGVFPWAAAPGVGGAKGRQYGCEDCEHPGGVAEIHDHGEAFAGFAWDLRTLAGAVTAENLLLGAFAFNPPDMQAAVSEVLFLTLSPPFGGTGSPASSPLYPIACLAAARHDFDCLVDPDFGSYGCALGLCAPHPAQHRKVGTEWLGELVFPGPCDPLMTPEHDGVSMSTPIWISGEEVTVTFELSVDPALKASGRYGPRPPAVQYPERRLYLNAWLFIDDGAGGGWTSHKVLGSGSGSGILGPNNVEPGIDAVAFDPDSWPGSTHSFEVSIPALPVSSPRLTILRVRLDYGEDAGRLEGCLSDPSLSGACGIARWGEVEDYQFWTMPAE